MTGDKPPLAMTMGDPAGIGPELALAAWRDRTPGAPFVVFAPPGVLAAAARRAGLAVPIIETDPAGAGAAFPAGLPVVPLEKRGRGRARPPGLSQRGGDARIDRARRRSGAPGPGARFGDQPDRQGHAL